MLEEQEETGFLDWDGGPSQKDHRCFLRVGAGTISVKGQMVGTPGFAGYMLSVPSLQLYCYVANAETDDTEMNKHDHVPIQLLTKMGGRPGCLAHGPPRADLENQPRSISIPCIIVLDKAKRS